MVATQWAEQPCDHRTQCLQPSAVRETETTFLTEDPSVFLKTIPFHSSLCLSIVLWSLTSRPVTESGWGGREELVESDIAGCCARLGSCGQRAQQLNESFSLLIISPFFSFILLENITRISCDSPPLEADAEPIERICSQFSFAANYFSISLASFQQS